MREIAFRGKRVVNGEWVYGDLHHGMITRNPYIMGKEVIPETVGQDTGLKDRHGVKIFEGDVLQNVGNPHVDRLLFEVVWSKHYGAWFWWALEGDPRTDHLGQSIAEDCEVIDNIHDNPELIGVKK